MAQAGRGGISSEWWLRVVRFVSAFANPNEKGVGY
jgi:hypothetical protein